MHLFHFIRSEHPQAIALILSFFDSDKTAKILSALPDDIQGNIALRIAMMGKVAPDILREMERVLIRRLSRLTLASEDVESSGGLDKAAEILKYIDEKNKIGIVEYLENKKPELLKKMKYGGDL